jgi:hypothetical protein
MKTLSVRRRAKALAALEATRAAQTEFWKCLRHLERTLQTDLVSTLDYREVSLDVLLDPNRRNSLI